MKSLKIYRLNHRHAKLLLEEKPEENTTTEQNLYFRKWKDAAAAMEDIVTGIVSGHTMIEDEIIQNDDNVWESLYAGDDGEGIVNYDYVEITEEEVR